MGKIAFVFSGQGDQFPGMGNGLAENYASARGVYEWCDRIRPGTSDQCFRGTEQELQKTQNTQPCLYATELAAAAVLTERGLRPDAAAGFSLGEIAAAAFCGVFDLEQGFRLVCRRGELMDQAAKNFDTAMAAVLKLSEVQVRDLCRQHEQLYPVNFNCPGQITVSGLKDSLAALLPEIRAAGGRAIPLKVAGGFHSPFMDEAARGFAEALQGTSLSQPRIPLYSDLTGLPYEGDFADLLSQQISHPVRWEALIRNLIARGFDTFVEIGPGRTLTTLMKKIDASVHALTAAEALEEQL